jgi:hypothetical protein
MPREILLSGRRISLTTETPKLNLNLMGVHHQSLNYIVLDGSMPPDQLKAIAVHEIVHDLEEIVGVGMTEQDVTAFSSVLFAAIRDNPKLMAWLQSK